MTHSLFSILWVLFAAVWLYRVGVSLVREFKKSGRTKWIVAILGVLTLIGALGFFAPALVALGQIHLPSTFEWPAGYVEGVVQTSSGEYVVPLQSTGRIQVYDPNWKFLYGWQIDAGGGDFSVRCTADGIIQVLTARRGHHFSFTEGGHPSYDDGSFDFDEYHRLPQTGRSFEVPTSPLLWIFSSPALSWSTAAIGWVGLVLLKRPLAQNDDGSLVGKDQLFGHW